VGAKLSVISLSPRLCVAEAKEAKSGYVVNSVLSVEKLACRLQAGQNTHLSAVECMWRGGGKTADKTSSDGASTAEEDKKDRAGIRTPFLHAHPPG
jgi:hypothetical protein